MNSIGSAWRMALGIVLLAVAILPLLGVGGMQLFRAEVPGPVAERLTPRISQTAKLLWGVYLVLTVLEIAALMIAGLSLFDAVCHAFTTMATGGFSTYNLSVGHFATDPAYNAPLIEMTITAFMFLAGANFGLYYQLLRRRWSSVYRDVELRVYLGLLGLGAVLAVLVFEAVFASGFEAARVDRVTGPRRSAGRRSRAARWRSSPPVPRAGRPPPIIRPGAILWVRCAAF